ncbi:hypothetical protein PR202_gb04273 [Eleusine coracana subsp. coracana]|uniref:Uncharacterized protein n=1 Tax=Eleusine coracana subsp. coracana TaxID=191504 RepID=A0AAV5E3H4_ELECO|nr:hypothetical protein PR202_gb04273 [Eleusine coracana subsp. coracana]
MLSLDMIQIQRVAYATAGDEQWTLSAWKFPPLLLRSAPFQGKLYVTSLYCASYQDNNIESAVYKDDDKVYIYRIDQPQPNGEGTVSLPPPVMIARCPLVDPIGKVYLVECGSGLMLVGCKDTSYSHLVAYRIDDLISGKIIPVKNIGEHALFLGERGLCVSANKGLPSVLDCQKGARLEKWSFWSLDDEGIHLRGCILPSGMTPYQENHLQKRRNSTDGTVGARRNLKERWHILWGGRTSIGCQASHNYYNGYKQLVANEASEGAGSQLTRRLCQYRQIDVINLV